MTGQPAVEPPVFGQGQKTPMRRLMRLWVVLTTEKIFHEEGTTARVTRVRTAIRGYFSGREPPRTVVKQAPLHRKRHKERMR